MKKNDIFYFLILVLTCSSCSNKDRILSLLEEWNQKEILFPEKLVYTIQGNDTVNFIPQSQYKIVSYVDSSGCTSCKLGLTKWKELMDNVDSLRKDYVSFIFVFSPEKSTEIFQSLRIAKFKYPICIDVDDSFNKLNHFPSDTRFQTFLLDENNKVVAIGNPIHNPKIKELYFDIIQGKKSVGKELTTVKLNKTSIDLSTFDWRKEKLADVELVNTGSLPLIIDDVVTSCSCTTVEFPRESVASGQSVKLKIKYNAEKPEPFYRTVSIYCNTKDSPLEIEITGEGK